LKQMLNWKFEIRNWKLKGPVGARDAHPWNYSCRVKVFF
jgi:hypothetical protein